MLFFTRLSVVRQRGAPLGQKGEGNGKLVQNLTFPSPFFPNGSPLWTLPSLNPFFHTLCQILTVLRKTLTCLLSYNVGIVAFYYHLSQTISTVFVDMTENVGEHAPCSLGWSEIKSKSRQKEGEARGKRVQRENRMEGGRNADFYCGFIVLPPSVRLSLC